MFEFTIPEDIPQVDTVTEKPLEGRPPLKFVEVARVNWLTDHRFSANDERLEQQEAVREAIRGKKAGDRVELHNNDHALLLEVVKCPEHKGPHGIDKGYGPHGNLILPFINAVKSAKKVEKKKLKAVEAAPASDDDDGDED